MSDTTKINQRDNLSKQANILEKPQSGMCDTRIIIEGYQPVARQNSGPIKPPPKKP